MTRFGYPVRLALLIVVTTWSAGCSTAPYPGRGPSAVITVNNERSVISSATIHLVPRIGTPTRLGTVELSQSREFRVRRAQLSGAYRLYARPIGGRGFYSPEFTMADGDLIEWDLRVNRVFLMGSTKGGAVSIP